MKVDLTKVDLINLVKNTDPYYDVFDNPLIKSLGYYSGGFFDGWCWDEDSLNELSESELWDVYILCKKQ